MDESDETDRLYAPSVARNRDPILAVLRDVLPASGTVLEVASGTGEHIVYFAQRFPGLEFLPSEHDPALHRSINAWRERLGLGNVAPPIELDVTRPAWPVERADAVIAINLIHIAPWRVSEGLMAGAGRLLPPDGPLFLYGPYRREGRHTAPSNQAFDDMLRSQNPAWGVRDLEAVVDLAAQHGLSLERIVAMPANNFSVVFTKDSERS